MSWLFRFGVIAIKSRRWFERNSHLTFAMLPAARSNDKDGYQAEKDSSADRNADDDVAIIEEAIGVTLLLMLANSLCRIWSIGCGRIVVGVCNDDHAGDLGRSDDNR